MNEFRLVQKDPDVYFSDDFVYRINPLDYITITGRLLNNPDLFREIESAKEKGEEEKIKNFASLLKNWEKIKDQNFNKESLEKAARDLETCRYFYKEIGASLKFNPLSRRDSGVHILSKIHEFLIKYNTIIRPKAIYSKIHFKSDPEGIKVNNSNILFESRKLKIFTSHSSVKSGKEISPDDLKGSDLFIYLVTIGPGIDKEIKRLSGKGDVFEAYVLNGIGAGAAEMIANDLNLYMNDNFGNGNNFKRLSPGYGDWPVTDQSKIFQLLRPEKYINVILTDSHIMLPEKSTSGIMGLVAN
jgi:hypothetical protein